MGYTCIQGRAVITISLSRCINVLENLLLLSKNSEFLYSSYICFRLKCIITIDKQLVNNSDKDFVVDLLEAAINLALYGFF